MNIWLKIKIAVKLLKVASITLIKYEARPWGVYNIFKQYTEKLLSICLVLALYLILYNFNCCKFFQKQYNSTL